MKIKFKFYFIIINVLLIKGCTFSPTNINKKYSKDSKLTFEILLNAKQIVKYEDKLFILINDNDEGEFGYKPYILLFNRDNDIESVFYFPIDYIYQISSDTIYAIKNEYSFNQYPSFIKDIPLSINYCFKLSNEETIINYNKIVDSIKVIDKKRITLYFSFSKDVYDGFRINQGENIEKNFIYKDTISINFEQLILSKELYFDIMCLNNGTNKVDRYYLRQEIYNKMIMDLYHKLEH